MKKIKNLLFILVIALIGFMGMNNVHAAENYGLWVNGEEFTSEKTTINCGNGTATFDNSTKTLTLNNATITKSSTITESTYGYYTKNYAAIASNSQITINLVGNNEISIPSTSNNTFLAGIFTGNNKVTIDGTGFLKISLNAPQGYSRTSVGIDSENAIIFNGGTVEIMYTDVAMTNNVDLSNYPEASFVSSYYLEWDGTFATSITDEEYNTLDCSHGYAKIGMFDVYTITGESEPSGLLSVQKDAIEGKKVYIDSKSSNYNPSSVKIYNLDNVDVTEEVGLQYNESWGDFCFIMPNYDVKLVVDYSGHFIGVSENLKSRLTTYKNVKLTWEDQGSNVYYRVYAKRYGATSYNFLTQTTKTYYTVTNTAPGVRYVFKVVPYIIDDITNEHIKAYWGGSTVQAWTLKKMAAPTVVKYNNSQVRVKWSKVNGASGYQIARSLYKTKNFTILKTVNNGYSSYRFKTTKNKTYYYKVRTYKLVDGKKIYGPWSNVKAFKLK